MRTEALTQILEGASRTLNVLRQGGDGYENGAVAELMADTYLVGTVLAASPKLRSEIDLQRFLDETVSVIEKQGVDLTFFPLDVLHQFEGIWEANEWERLCVVRSGLQFFIELFQETALAEHVASIDTSAIDGLIRERGSEGYLSDDQIPPEIPLSHWWWWYPEPPRRRQA